MKTKFLILFILIVAGLIAVSFLLSPKDVPPPEKLTKKAEFSVLIPGQTKREEVFKKTGEPSFVETKNGRTYLYYETQNSSFRDLVVLENGVELYALENIFSDSELTLESATKSFGNYETRYSEAGPFLWYVFLQRGIAIETDEKDILKVLYFVPMTDEEFLAFFGEELGIIKEPPTPEVLRP